MDEEIKEKINETILFVNNETNDWFIIKKLIVNQLNSKSRTKFSRRHYSTKKHIINSFEMEVIKYWEEQTGIKLWINPEKMHPVDWVKRSRGWALKIINKERKKRILEKLSTQQK